MGKSIPIFFCISGAHQGLAAVAERDVGPDQEARGQGQGRVGGQGREGRAAEAGDCRARAAAGNGAGKKWKKATLIKLYRPCQTTTKWPEQILQQ
jgi:hypothetical protein